MSFPNIWNHRKVAETAAKACEICYKPSSSVLVTPDNKDWFYICPMHLKDAKFCSPVVDHEAEAEAARKKKQEEDEEIARLKKEYEEKQRKKKEKEKEKDKEGGKGRGGDDENGKDKKTDKDEKHESKPDETVSPLNSWPGYTTCTS